MNTIQHFLRHPCFWLKSRFRNLSIVLIARLFLQRTRCRASSSHFLALIKHYERHGQQRDRSQQREHPGPST